MSFYDALMVGTLVGKVSVAFVFGLLILFLLNLPASVCSMLEENHLPRWRQSRFWAVLIALVQVLVYLWFG
ncbi:MAG: hypothetical protein P8L18_01505 [Verrucomicrobiota bacterium]|nr:hypothetical protein [Verrucomicrobiota bacterium]